MATSAETLKTTAEKYSAAGTQAFKEAFEKSLTALNEPERPVQVRIWKLSSLRSPPPPRAPKPWAPQRSPIRRSRWKTTSPPPSR